MSRNSKALITCNSPPTHSFYVSVKKFPYSRCFVTLRIWNENVIDSISALNIRFSGYLYDARGYAQEIEVAYVILALWELLAWIWPKVPFRSFQQAREMPTKTAFLCLIVTNNGWRINTWRIELTLLKFQNHLTQSPSSYPVVLNPAVMQGNTSSTRWYFGG